MSEILTEQVKLLNKHFTLYKKVYFSDNFYNQKLKYKDKIKKIRNKTVYNIGNSANKGAEYINNLI